MNREVKKGLLASRIYGDGWRRAGQRITELYRTLTYMELFLYICLHFEFPHTRRIQFSRLVCCSQYFLARLNRNTIDIMGTRRP